MLSINLQIFYHYLSLKKEMIICFYMLCNSVSFEQIIYSFVTLRGHDGCSFAEIMNINRVNILFAVIAVAIAIDSQWTQYLCSDYVFSMTQNIKKEKYVSTRGFYTAEHSYMKSRFPLYLQNGMPMLHVADNVGDYRDEHFDNVHISSWTRQYPQMYWYIKGKFSFKKSYFRRILKYIMNSFFLVRG